MKAVADLRKLNAGDIMLAMPYIQSLKNVGYNISIAAPKKAYLPIKELCNVSLSSALIRGISNIRFLGTAKHITDRWGEALRVRNIHIEPSRIDPSSYKGSTVLLQPWCLDVNKRFNTEYWKEAAKVALEAGFCVRIAGPKEYMNEANLIKGSLPDIENYVGKDKDCWVDTIRNSCLVVTPDSGAGHVADALGIPTVVLFKSTDPEVWAPYWDRNGVLDKPSIKQVKDMILHRLINDCG